jgi:hypothetical protein
LTSFALGCSDATSASKGQVSITTIACAQSVEDATSRTYTVSADGKAEGPVGSVVTLLFGKGTGLADPNHTSET